MKPLTSKPSSFFYGQLGVLAIGLLVRLIHLNGSFWLDEAAQAIESMRPLSDQLNIPGDFQPPLFHLLVHFWMMGGTSEWWLRLTSLIPGLITIWLTMQLGKKLAGEHAGLIAGILLATSQFHVFYSQELRPYSFAAMWAMVVLFSFYQLKRYPRKAAAGFVIGSVAGLYSMYVFPLFLITLLIMTALFYRQYLRKVIGMLIGAGLTFIPWLPAFIEQFTIGMSLEGNSSVWANIVSPPLWKMLPLTAIKFLLGRIAIDLNFQMGIISLLAIYVTLRLISKAWQKREAKQLLWWLLIPIGLAFVISLWVPILDPKRVLFCLPLFYLLLAAGIGKDLKSAVITVVLLSVNMYSITQYATNENEQREPWREAIAKVEQLANQNDVVVFDFPDGLAPWSWYQRRNLEIAAIPKAGTLVNYLDKRTSTLSVDRYIVFDYLMDMTDPKREVIAKLNELGYFEVNYLQYPGIGKIRFFQPLQPIALVANP